jgi:hypothetical protein
MLKPSGVRRLFAVLAGVLALTGATAASASAATTSHAVRSPASAHAASVHITRAEAAAGIISSSKPIRVTQTSTSSASRSVTSAGAKPDTFTNGCSSSQSTWVHGYATSYAWEVDHATWCVGDKGTTSLPINSTLWICSGNNYGSIGYYIIVNGVRHDYSINMPEDDLFAFASTVRVTHITINGWNFNYSC